MSVVIVDAKRHTMRCFNCGTKVEAIYIRSLEVTSFSAGNRDFVQVECRIDCPKCKGTTRGAIIIEGKVLEEDI